MSDFEKELRLYVRAQYPILAVETFEWKRLGEILDILSKDVGRSVATWSRVEGLVRKGKVIERTEDPVDAAKAIYSLCTSGNDSEPEILVLYHFHRYLLIDEIAERFRVLAPDLKYRSKILVLVGPRFEIPPELQKDVALLQMPLPGADQLRAAFEQFAGETKTKDGTAIRDRVSAGAFSAELPVEAANAAQGLTYQEAYSAYIRAYLETDFRSTADAVASVLAQKEQVIRKGGVVDYYRPEERMEDVGGLQNLKSWLDQRGRAFYSKARSFGLPEPKGVLLCGVPGCGKSLTAKAVAARWRLPLLRLDVGRVFSSFVGSSEGNIRTAIALAEAISPCVLWLDEIEKGFAGFQSSGMTDGGTTARVFATFLTWMQEKQKPVFVIATANDIDNLPPELLRKGRFDEIFFIDLPARGDREEIFRIFIQRKRRDPKRFDLTKLGLESAGFNGAEIEAAVERGLFAAFARLDGDKDAELSMKDLLDAISSTMPLSATRRTQIEKMRTLAKGRFVMASSQPAETLGSREVELTSAEQGKTVWIG